MKHRFRFRTATDIDMNDGTFIQAVNVTEARRMIEKEHPRVYAGTVEIAIVVKGIKEWKVLWKKV